MTINPTQNSPIQLSDNSGMVANGKAKLVSEALTPFVNGFRVSKDLSKLSDTRIRDVKSLDFSNAKKFFSSLAQAIRDICYNIDAFLSTPGQNLRIHIISSQTSILLDTLETHKGYIEDLRSSGSDDNNKELNRATKMLRDRLGQLKEKIKLSGEGKAVLEQVQTQINKALKILEPRPQDKVRGEVVHVVDKAQEFVKKGVNQVEKGMENLNNGIEKGVKQLGNKFKQGFNNLISKIKK
jgi:ElaB/YqjD/DUF883 family membrane-anchored ribosome-binding protein